MNWTKRKRFYLEPTKSHALVFHKVLGKVTLGNESKDLVDVFSSLKLLVLLEAERGTNILQKDTGKTLLKYLYMKIPVFSLNKSSTFKIFNFPNIG